MTEQSNTVAIAVDLLTSHYGDREILREISFTVAHREIFVVMGTSGAGKSTLLRALLGLIRPTSGTVSVLGHNLMSLDRKSLFAVRKRIGVAFQGGALFSSMTIGENVSLPLRQHTALDPRTIQIMTRLKLELMNLTNVEHLMPAQLSGGMLKRAGLARAAVMDPRILFFDEPSAGLDPVNAAELDELILKLRNALGATIFVVTHDLESAFKIADRIMVLANGEAIITGTVDQITGSDDVRIQNMLHRRPDDGVIDGDAYLNRLTGSF